MLALDGVTFRYAAAEAPWRFDLEVAPGEIVGIAGVSGAGKSTLLDLIAGFLIPLAGDITLDGRSLLTEPPEARPVSILFQTDNLFDHLSAARNVALGLAPNKLPRAQRQARVQEALDAVELGNFSNRVVARLSGGQKQRVALARTLLRDKPILLLDEPFTALDPETAAEVREHLSALIAAHRWHTVLVSHDAEDLAAVGARILVVDGGRLTPA